MITGSIAMDQHIAFTLGFVVMALTVSGAGILGVAACLTAVRRPRGLDQGGKPNVIDLCPTR